MSFGSDGKEVQVTKMPKFVHFNNPITRIDQLFTNRFGAPLPALLAYVP